MPAKALELYAKEAPNYESELRALDIRIRASVRAGELIAEGQKNGTIAVRADGGRPPKHVGDGDKLKPRTLAQLGISRDQSSQWQRLAGVPAKELEEHLPVRTGKRTSPEKIIRDARPKPDPVKLRALLWISLTSSTA